MTGINKEHKILDIGCGADKVEGALGIDRIPRDNVNVVCELGAPVWPFADDTFDEIHAIHVMEHMEDPLHFMNEIHRVGKPGCRVVIRTPHKSHIESFRDPTHKFHFVLETFDYFNGSDDLNKLYGQKPFNIIKKDVLRISKPGRWICDLFSLRHWERHWSNFFPAKEIEVFLEVSK